MHPIFFFCGGLDGYCHIMGLASTECIGGGVGDTPTDEELIMRAFGLVAPCILVPAFRR